MTFTMRQDRALIRANGRSDRYVLLQLTAPHARVESPRAPVNVAFVVDRSGSMSGQKIQLARHAVEQAIARLREDDRFAVVVYDDQIDVVVESTGASPEARKNALQRLAKVDARGSTNLAEGWLRGCEQVGLHQTDRNVNRVLLLTDGLANVGITDRHELERHSAELRARGVSTTTFGVGADFDEALLQAISDAGGGHFYYVETAQQIPDHITSEVGETLEVVASDVAIAIHAPDVLVEPLSALSHHRAGEATFVQLGDLVSEQALDIVLKLNFPYGQIGDRVEASVRLVDREGVLGSAVQTLAWQYADTRSNDAQPRDRAVDRAVAALYAARARQEAVALNRTGRYEAARARIEAVARRIRRYAGDDRQLRAIIHELEAEVPVYARVMEESLRKRTYFAASAVAHSRDVQGRARRST